MNRGLLAALAAFLASPAPDTVPASHQRSRPRRGQPRRRARRWVELVRRWDRQPPAEGYCRGKLRRESAWRALRGERPIPYPEPKPHRKGGPRR